MKLTHCFATLILLLATQALAQSDAQKGFEKMKSLSGTWVSEMQGETGTETYKVVSGGTAVMSDATHDGMISILRSTETAC